MTVPTEVAGPVVMLWTGVETQFTPGFRALTQAAVRMTARTRSNDPLGAGHDLPLVLDVNYTVRLGPDNSVTVFPKALPPPPLDLLIWRDTPATQVTPFVDLAAYKAIVHEKLHDAAALRAAEFQRDFTRAAHVRIGETLTELPRADLRAAQIFGFDAAGQPLMLPQMPAGGGVVPQADLEVAIYKLPDRIEQVAVPAHYEFISAGGFLWRRGAAVPTAFNRISLDGAAWHLWETNLFPEIWGDATTGRNPQDLAQDDAPAFNMMFDYARAVMLQAPGENPTKPLNLNFWPGAHYAVLGSIDATGMTWQNNSINGNNATIWGRCKDKPVIDAVGSMTMKWTGGGVMVRGDRVLRPTYGLQYGRENTDASRSNNHLLGIRFTGWYSRAACVNSAAEVGSVFQCSFVNRDTRRSSFAYVIDAWNQMGLDTEFHSIVNNHDGLHFSSVTLEGTNWASNEIIIGLTSGARRRRRNRNPGNLFIGVEHVVAADSPYFGLTNAIPFVIGETVAGEITGKQGVLARVSKWARSIGDRQSCNGIEHISTDFRKVDLLAQQEGTGSPIALFPGPPGSDAEGMIRQYGFVDCYSVATDQANIQVHGNLFNCHIEMHCETQQPVGNTPTINVVVVDAARQPIRTFVTGETLTGATSGVIGEVLGYLDDDTDYVSDQVRVSVTPSSDVLTGTVTVTPGEKEIVGVGTLFLTELSKFQRIRIVETGEVLVVMGRADDTHLNVANAPMQEALGSNVRRLNEKFLLDEVINASVSGAGIGTVDSGYGPRHTIEVMESGAVWMEHVDYRDHNPHAWQSVIAKRGTTLTMANCNVNVRSTHWDVPLMQLAQASGPGGQYGPVDFHGTLLLGEGGAQETTQLKNLAAGLRRMDGVVFSDAGDATQVLLPDAGDAMVLTHAGGAMVQKSRSRLRLSGRVGGNLETLDADIVTCAATIDLGAAFSNLITLNGSTGPVTSFGTADAGVFRFVTVSNNPTFNHHASNLILPFGGANKTAAPGDTFMAMSLGAGAWRVLFWTNADGT